MRNYTWVKDPETGKYVPIPIIKGGMPTGTGAVNLRNLPNVAYEVNPAKFFALTERNIFDPINFAAPAPANYVTQQLLQVGVVSQLRFVVKGAVSITEPATATAVTPTFKWPYGIFSAVMISGNGMNNFINCPSTVLWYRQLMQNRALVDAYTSLGGLNVAVTPPVSATTNYVFAIQIIVPLAMDNASLIGALYAQSEATNLTFTLYWEATANLFTFTTATVAILNTTAGANTTPQVYVEETFFEVPYDPSKSDTLVIPDLTVLHGIITNYNPVAGLSQVTTPLYRINGQLERLLFWMDNNNALTVTANYALAQLIYGGNQTPYTWNPMDFLRIKNMEDYRFTAGTLTGALANQVGLPDGVFSLDLVSENPVRDQVLLEGVTNLRLFTQTAAAFVPNAAARMAFTQETLFA